MKAHFSLRTTRIDESITIAGTFIKEVNEVYLELLGNSARDVRLALLPCWPSSVPVSLMETPE